MSKSKHLPDRKPSVDGPINGNIFAVMGAARLALRRAGFRDAVEELTDRVMKAGSYAMALAIIQEYVDLNP